MVVMADTNDVRRVKLSVWPTKEELVLWNSLSRDEQVVNMRLDMQEAAESGISDITMEEIIERAKARVAEHRLNNGL